MAPHHPRGGGIILNSMTTIIVDPLRFEGGTDNHNFWSETRSLCDFVAASAAIQGTRGVRLPGQVEREAEAERLREGVPIAPGTLADLQDVAKSLGITGAHFEELLGA